MTVKELKKILDSYPDEFIVYGHDAEWGDYFEFMWPLAVSPKDHRTVKHKGVLLY